MNTLRLRMKPYIQPFERVLALRELRAISGAEPRPLGLFEEMSMDFELQSARAQSDLVERLAYWETVEHGSYKAVVTLLRIRSRLDGARCIQRGKPGVGEWNHLEVIIMGGVRRRCFENQDIADITSRSQLLMANAEVSLFGVIPPCRAHD